jgi:hypothetical protein
VSGPVPPGWLSADPDDMPKFVDLAASIVGLEPSEIAALTVVVGDIGGQVAVISGHTHPMAIMSLLADGIGRVASAEIEALGQSS